MRKLKSSGLAFVAVFAISGAFATAASAAQFNSEWLPTYLSGAQTTQNVISLGSLGSMKCETAKFSGKTAEKSAASVAVHPTYQGCTSFGQNVTIDTTGCNYVLTASSQTAGNMSIQCEAGKAIVLSGPTIGCTITVKGQTPSNNAVTYQNAGAGSTRSIGITQFVGQEGSTGKGIAYTSSGGYCGASGANGFIRGSISVNGYANEALTKQVGIWVQ